MHGVRAGALQTRAVDGLPSVAAPARSESSRPWEERDASSGAWRGRGACAGTPATSRRTERARMPAHGTGGRAPRIGPGRAPTTNPFRARDERRALLKSVSR
eukprot:5991538-Prymnesium_polylepis.1